MNIEKLIEAERTTRITYPMNSDHCKQHHAEHGNCEGCKFSKECKEQALKSLEATTGMLEELVKENTIAG